MIVLYVAADSSSRLSRTVQEFDVIEIPGWCFRHQLLLGRQKHSQAATLTGPDRVEERE
jgi:hypothetical protein